jgi:hypothetical protein
VGDGATVTARIILFALDDLRARYGGCVPADADPRHDTSPFRAFRAELLALAARVASGPAELSFWWDGTYNGYALAVAIVPADALAGLSAEVLRLMATGVGPEPACPIDDERVATARADRYPLAFVEPGTTEVARDADGAAWEAPFGAATGHFGAPGVRRVR